MPPHDLVIIGGGIVGLATAFRFLERFPDRRVAVLEKEAVVATHQTGHNSGVLHSGIYYRPGSLKAQNCRAGRIAMEDFCRREQISFETCGKVIVAVDDSELVRLEKILANGQANGVACQRIDVGRLREIEPYAAGVAGIHVPETGIVDFGRVAKRLSERIAEQGGTIVTAARATALRLLANEAVVETTTGDFAALHVVNCAGLHSDRVARLSGTSPSAKIVPFRGEYYTLRPEAHHLVRTLIYPVPDPAFHSWVFTSRAASAAKSNAARTPSWLSPAKATASSRSIRATWPKHSLTAASGSWPPSTGGRARAKCGGACPSGRLFVPYSDWCPRLKLATSNPPRRASARQAVDHDGRTVDDFLIEETERVTSVCNAPSPAATSSLNIGRLIVDRVAERM